MQIQIQKQQKIILTVLAIVAQVAAVILFILYGDYDIEIVDTLLLPIPLFTFIIYISYRMYVLRPNKFNIFLLLGISCHFLGDILLVLTSQLSISNLFIGGLAAFLIGHIFNLIAFTIPPFPNLPKVQLKILYAIPYWIFGIIVFLLILFLGNASTVINVALAIYCAVITSAAWRVCARYGYQNENRTYSILAIVGYSIFVISDSLNGMGRYNVINWGLLPRTIIVLGTYWIGQGLITFSVDMVQQKAEKYIQ